ncbi:MAG: cofactor-independent phosphoglycerate mutase [Dehalococcoidales bacterium]|nr:MAG: cofactor-independent phosphoglycerate mutase [Dehalococcoidales bacterium]
MKYGVLIIDGAAGLPLPEHSGKTSLELAETPNLDAMAPEGTLGLIRTVPEGMEASSACACMSLLGYDPAQYYQGRAAIEARSMGIPIGEEEVVFRCNLVAVRDGRMWDYSAGHIGSDDARKLIDALNEKLSSYEVSFYPGVSYRHICKLKGHEETIEATCTPPHDIPERPIADYLPSGPGSDFLKKLMLDSQEVLREHSVNMVRAAVGEIPATMIWLFWGSSQPREMPAFGQVYGLKVAMTSGVDLLNGLARMADISVLDIPGVTDGLDNDYLVQAAGALKSLNDHDLVVVHIEAPDEAAHSGSIADKVDAIQRIDREVVGQFRAWKQDDLRLLVLPDHATPIVTRTHSGDPVPFMLWGKGFTGNGTKRFTEAEADKTGLLIDPGYNIMNWLVGRD